MCLSLRATKCLVIVLHDELNFGDSDTRKCVLKIKLLVCAKGNLALVRDRVSDADFFSSIPIRRLRICRRRRAMTDVACFISPFSIS